MVQRTGFLFLSVLMSVFAVCGGSALAQSYAPGELIVKLKSNGKSTAVFLGKASVQSDLILKKSWGKMNMHHFALKAGQTVEQKIAELNNDPDVEYAEPNFILSVPDVLDKSEVFSAAEIAAQAEQGEYLATGAPINAQEAWGSLTVTDTKPIVAVIDTGLDITHPVFTGSDAVWRNSDEIAYNGIDDDGNGYIDDVNGYNFVAGSGDMHDDDDHGTHVAGIILGTGQDIYTAPFAESKIKIMPLKFLDSDGVGKTSDAIKAIYYAVQNGATVINNSWGGPSYSSALHEAVVYSYNKGVTFIAASGNAGTDNDFSPMYPASYSVPHVVSVAAITDTEQLASFSNFGKDSVHIGSPGVFIRSTVPGGGYKWMSGTSMATPFVSGTAALMLIEKPTMLGYQVKTILMDQSQVAAGLLNKVSSEARLDVANSIAAAKGSSIDGDQPVYTFSSADREIASNVASGGCGLVTKLAKDFRGRSSQGGPNAVRFGTWYIFIVIGLLCMPLVILNIYRSRTPESRRRHKRFDVDTSVSVSVDGRDLVGSISSISLGGAQLNVDSLLSEGGVVKMSIENPDGSGLIEVKGNVVWRESKASYGVQFSKDQNSALEKISLWTKALGTLS